GDEALRRELEARRVDAELIEAALSDGQSDEEQRCRELVRSRIDHRDRERLREERDGGHRRRLSRRLDALLTRKGYPGDLAVHVIAGELRAAAEDPAASPRPAARGPTAGGDGRRPRLPGPRP